jgi:hypothetical protein
MEELLAQLKGAIDDIASCLDDPVHDEWIATARLFTHSRRMPSGSMISPTVYR